ncbi:acylphosphatase [Duganella sp. LX20W]|uniref:acylphosphatase n=1 Tax=Rugamonas brunnea TaxID=2758569 RepID=A0A7W2EVM2_9BURK|nr:acylphosphatase [Rugamonas brunnea]MBA5639422.1 acylphosphatase [Rugamonas brunnea]
MAKRLIIEGRVQGVGYRASFARQAEVLGLDGWVRNCRDGSVEACIHGDVAAMEAVITWARRGPPSARVIDVTVEEFSAEGLSGSGLRILPTA